MTFKSLVPWSRTRTPATYSPFVGLQDEINRMFDDMWRGFGTPTATRASSTGVFSTMPAIGVAETDKSVDVTIELPGLSEKDVELTLENDVLTVRGEKRDEKNDQKAGYTERWYGAFERSVALPPGLLADKADAKFKDGVLTVSVPRTEQLQAKAKKIAIARL
jgi:HSP20 family protein